MSAHRRAWTPPCEKFAIFYLLFAILNFHMTADLNIWTSLLAFAGAAGLLTIVPGLDTLLVLRTATVEGPRRAMFDGLGICTGCLAWGVLVSAGLGRCVCRIES